MFCRVASRCRITFIALGTKIIIVTNQALVPPPPEVAFHAEITAHSCRRKQIGKVRRKNGKHSSSMRNLCQQQQHPAWIFHHPFFFVHSLAVPFHNVVFTIKPLRHLRDIVNAKHERRTHLPSCRDITRASRNEKSNFCPNKRMRKLSALFTPRSQSFQSLVLPTFTLSAQHSLATISKLLGSARFRLDIAVLSSEIFLFVSRPTADLRFPGQLGNSAGFEIKTVKNFECQVQHKIGIIQA